jgi:hypothetical protein
MTAPAQVQSIIITKIFEHYRMLEGDVLALNQQITQQLVATYKMTIQSQLTLYGCQKLATGPDQAAQRWIDAKAAKDSEGISATYDRELKNKIARLRQDAPRGNRFYYLKALDEWINQRNAFKVPSISLNTMTAAREYAKDRFITENGIEGKFVFTGPPPVCKLCIRVKALGPIPYRQTRLARNRLPQHVNCPHTYQQLIPKKIDCETAWTG